MNSDKILNSIPKLQKLDEKSLDLISSAIDSCLAVQALEQACRNPVVLQKLVTSIKV